MTIDCQHECFIVPPDVVAEVGDRSAQARRVADNPLAASAAIRVRRDLATSLLQQMNVGLQELAFFAPPKGQRRTVYDARNTTDLPGRKVRGEDDPSSGDAAVNEAFDGAESTYRFYADVFKRDSIDNQGLELVST